MKRCSYCGEEFSDQLTVCPNDGHPLVAPPKSPLPKAPPPLVSQPQPKIGADGRYLKYEDVPWYRREPGMLAMIGVLLFPVVSIILCVICLTGDVYKKSYDRKGRLEVWGISNKIAAVVILIIQGFMLWLYHWQANQ